MITELLLVILIILAVIIITEQKIVRMIIYLAAFSFVSSLCFLFVSAPDAAMAEAVVSAFVTVIFIVAMEKYFRPPEKAAKKPKDILKHIAPIAFTAALFVLFVIFAPEGGANTELKERYISRFSADIGGENAVTAIYLGYRVYDTLFETLLLLVSVAAVIHLSRHTDIAFKSHSRHLHIPESDIALGTIRIISPILVIFGIYLVLNGHLSPGGGFQGGVVIASFFVCRYLIYDISDIRVKGALIAEKILFAFIILLASAFMLINLPVTQNAYLISMNVLIGAKVAFGFLIIFYRFITFERK